MRAIAILEAPIMHLAPPTSYLLYIAIGIGGFISISLWSTWLVTHPGTIESGFGPEFFKFYRKEWNKNTF